MIKTKALAGVVALSALVAACSGGGSENKEAAKTAEVEASAPAPAAAPVAAPAAPAGPPAATDVTTLDGSTFASLTGNAAAGKMVFAQCRTCHVTDAGVNKTGPSF